MLFYILIIAVLVALDQITKYIIHFNMYIGEKIEVIPNFFYITSARNEGAAFSILQGQMRFFYIITIIALLIFSYFLIKEGDIQHKKLYTISLLFMISGTIGNFIDRILHQKVIDFLDFIIFGWDFAIFNVADTLLTIGTIGFAISILFLHE